MTTLSQPSTPVVKRFSYPLDQTGRLESNLIKKEYHTITPQNRTPQNIIIPGFAPYYRHSLVIRERRNSASVPLREGIDYTCEWPVLSTGNQTEGYTPLYIGIQFIDEQITGEFELEYQTVGGQFALDGVAVAQALANNAGDPLTTTYEQILGKPLQLPPIEHVHSIHDFVGFNDLVQELINLRDAIVSAWREDRDAHPGYETLIDEYFRLLDELEKTNNNLDSNATNFNAALERFSNSTNDAINALRTEMRNDVQNKIQVINTNLDALRTEMRNDVQNKIQVINTNLDALRAALTQTEQNLRDFINDNFNTFRQQTNQSFTDVRNTIAANKTDIENKLNTAKNDLTSALNTLRTNLTDLINVEKNRNNTQDAKIGTLETRLDGNEFVKTGNVNQTIDGIKTFKKGLKFGSDTVADRGTLTADANNMIIRNTTTPAQSTLLMGNNGVMEWTGNQIVANQVNTAKPSVKLKGSTGAYSMMEYDPTSTATYITAKNATGGNVYSYMFANNGNTGVSTVLTSGGTSWKGHGNWESQKTSTAPYFVSYLNDSSNTLNTFRGSDYYPIIKGRGYVQGSTTLTKTLSYGWLELPNDTTGTNGAFVLQHILSNDTQTHDDTHWVWQFHKDRIYGSQAKFDISGALGNYITIRNFRTDNSIKEIRMNDSGELGLINFDKLSLGPTTNKIELYRDTNKTTLRNAKNDLKVDLADNADVTIGTGNKLGNLKLEYTNGNNVTLSYTNNVGFNINQPRANKNLSLNNDGRIKWGNKDIIWKEGHYLRNNVPENLFGGYEIYRPVGTEYQYWRIEAVPNNNTNANVRGAFKLFRSATTNGDANAKTQLDIIFPNKSGTVALISDVDTAKTQLTTAYQNADTELGRRIDGLGTTYVTLGTAQTITGQKTFTQPVKITANGELTYANNIGLQIKNIAANKYLELHHSANYIWTNYDNLKISSGKTILTNTLLNINSDGSHAGITTLGLGTPGAGWGSASFTREQNNVLIHNHKTINGAQNTHIRLYDDGYIDFKSNNAAGITLQGDRTNYSIQPTNEGSTPVLRFHKISIQDFYMRSDMRLKENIKPIENALDTVAKLNGYTYNLKGETKGNAGIIAQELQEVLPELVSENSETGMLSVNHISLIGYLIEAVKELKNDNEELRNRITELENK